MAEWENVPLDTETKKKTSGRLRTAPAYGRAVKKRVPFVTSPILGRPGGLIDRERHGTGDKDNKSVNGTRIFHWEVSSGKTGLPFQEFRLFRKISSGTSQKVVFHLQPDRNFRNFLVNGKRSLSPGALIFVLDFSSPEFFSLARLEISLPPLTAPGSPRMIKN